MYGIITSVIQFATAHPVILFFIWGLIAAAVKSDLKIPNEVSKFLSYFLLFCIGLKGGHKLVGASSEDMFYTLALAVSSSIIIPVIVFFIIKRFFKVQDACALAATFGSVSLVTYITTTHYLEQAGIHYDHYMTAALALMESPAIIIGISLLNKYDTNHQNKSSSKEAIKHAFTNGSVMMLLGCLLIGYLLNGHGYEELTPLSENLFKGFLAFFMLDMGIIAGKRMKSIPSSQKFKLLLIGVFIPLLSATIMFLIGIMFPLSKGNFILLLILSSSASYIAVPATMRTAAPKANPGIYTAVALGITFPFNISVGIPLYHKLVELWIA